ncbi:MAG: hypothetical protein QM791_00335 [Ferruginibacter sp.]
MMIYNIHLLPARFGDAILIEYGEQDHTRKILIDGGTAGTSRHILAELNKSSLPVKLELLVISHIDRDHIEGVLSFLETPGLNIAVEDVWFNGWRHLPGNEPRAETESFGAKHGERLTAAILTKGLPWNRHFHGKAVVIEDNNKLPAIELEGGMEITLLSPYAEHLTALRDKWEQEIIEAGLVPDYGSASAETETETGSAIEAFGTDSPNIPALVQEQFEEDNSAANGSSIAFLATFDNKTVLFAADALPAVLTKSLNQISPGNIPINLAKVSHHASAGNTSPELIDKLATKQFAISTNGSIYHHPSRVTIARIIHQKGPGVKFYFNYRSKWNGCWGDEALRDIYNYSAIYPDQEGIVISIV